MQKWGIMGHVFVNTLRVNTIKMLFFFNLKRNAGFRCYSAIRDKYFNRKASLLFGNKKLTTSTRNRRQKVNLAEKAKALGTKLMAGMISSSGFQSRERFRGALLNL